MIEPTPGRVLHYWPLPEEVGEAGFTMDGSKPLAAHVAFVHSPTCINVMLIDARGCPHGRESVVLNQGDDAIPGTLSWMAYQKGQAAKAEQLEQELVEQAKAPEPAPSPPPAPAAIAEPVNEPLPAAEPQPTALDALVAPQS